MGRSQGIFYLNIMKYLALRVLLKRGDRERVETIYLMDLGFAAVVSVRRSRFPGWTLVESW